jgi:cellulose synthase/poly-beta-1,6-N-acetylglucosamine synthase-like glycosyltransferase
MDVAMVPKSDDPSPADLSVVIPARDEAERLPRTLEAVLRSAERVRCRLELVVADHGSRDRTAEHARRAGATVVDAAAARTIAAVRNLGARAVTGRILAFLDADCVPGAGWVSCALAAFDDPEVGAAGLAPRAPDAESWTARASALVALPRRPGPGVREPARWLPSANLLVRRDAFELAGGFDEELVTCEDYDLTLRIGALGWRLVRDGGLDAVHAREPLSARELFRKERWRGRSSFEGARRHGLAWGEVPSLVLPPAHAALALGVVVALARGDVAVAAVLAVLLAAPSLALAARVAVRAGESRELAALVAFFAVYNAARVAALVPVRERAARHASLSTRTAP